MTTFHLTVVTPDGCAFDGQAERVVCRAIDGDLAILAKHGFWRERNCKWS